MGFRLSRMSLGGKLSLGYLAFASFLFVGGGRDSEWFAMVLGFPLVYLPWVVDQLAGRQGAWPQPLGVVMFVTLWVGNAYLWGHLAAAAIRLASRANSGRSPGGGAGSAEPPLHPTGPADSLPGSQRSQRQPGG